MRLATILIAAVAISGGVARGEEEALPAGAVVRLGTSQFRFGIPVSNMQVSADEKFLVAVNGNHMLGATRMFDLGSGRALYTLPGTSIEAAAISPDGRTLVTKEDFSVHVRDAKTGVEDRARQVSLPRVDRYSRNEWVTFTPDGKAFAVTSQGMVVHLIDAATGTVIREFSNANPESKLSDGFTTVLAIAFSPDGKVMAGGGFANDNNDYFVRLWDVASGREIGRLMHGLSYGIPSLAFSGDGRMLATGAHDARLRVFEVETGKLVRGFPADGSSRMENGCVAFSPDNKTVAAAAGALRLYDVTSGKELWRLDRKASGLTFTDGGKTLTGAVGATIYRWDAATGRPLTPEGGDSPVEQVIVSGDGTRVVTRGAEGDAHLWEAVGGRHLRQFRAAGCLAMSPDGRYLAWPVSDSSVRYPDVSDPRTIHYGSRIRLYDVAAGKTVERFVGFKGDASDLAFIDEGKRLVTVGHSDAGVRVWDVASGKEERSFVALREAERKQSGQVWRAEVSPDGRTVAVAYVMRPPGNVDRLGMDGGETYPIRVWDMASGRETHQFEGTSRYVQNLAFSPDGRWLVVSGSAFDAVGGNGRLTVWNVVSGKAAATLATGACAAAFAGDGRYLATATPDDVTRVWETATWTLRGEYSGHRDRAMALAFAPNRPVLYCGGMDTTVLGWDLRIPAVAGGSLEKAWGELDGRDAREALKAEGQFIAAPAEAVRLFAERIKPAEAVGEKEIQRWIVELDSPEFATREAASRALGLLGERARPQLEKALAATTSAEVRQRIGAILSPEREVAPPPAREVRAVAILEQLADPAARALLARWAGGEPTAPLTIQAAGAMWRLESAK